MVLYGGRFEMSCILPTIPNVKKAKRHLSSTDYINLHYRNEVKFMNKNWLNNKCVIITGASSGMGKGITMRLIREHNCRVIGIARSEQKMVAMAEELGTDAYKFSYKLFDVANLDSWKEFVKYIEESGIQPDVLINCAGILPKFDKFQNLSIEYIKSIMDINFFSCVYSMNLLLPILLKSESPAIINVDSSSALLSLAGTSVYSASKASLKTLTESMREELRGKCYVGIICPGFTKTDIFRNQNAADTQDKLIDMIATPCDKMVNMIMRNVRNKSRLAVLGKDAVAMDIMGRIMPVLGSRICSSVMKMSKLSLFSDVFKD